MITVKVVNGADHTSVYPKIMISQRDGAIVLFTDYETGCVLKSVSEVEPLGHHADDWAMGYFADFNGSVTLSNEG
jgi:hypothetical protein